MYEREVASDVTIRVVVERARGFRIHLQQRRVGLEQLLDVRQLPLARRRVAIEPASLAIVKAPVANRVERALDDPPGPDVAVCRVQRQREVQWRGQRELRRDAKAAVLLVKAGEDEIDESVERRCVITCDDPGRVGRRLRPLDLVAARAHGFEHPLKNARHVIGGHERPAAQQVAGSRQKRGRRPSPKVVAVVDVRPAIGVDADRNEGVLNQRDDGRVGVRRAIHVVTRPAPGRRDGQQDRLTLARRAGEGVRAPRQPCDAVTRDGGQCSMLTFNAECAPRRRTSRIEHSTL